MTKQEFIELRQRLETFAEKAGKEVSSDRKIQVLDYGQFAGSLQPTIDWQHYRIQAAIAAMNIVKGAYNVHNDMERLVRHSVKLADALIAELKKGGEQ